MSTEIPEWINEKTVEQAFRRAELARIAGNRNFATKGYRAAVAKDAKLLLALDKGAEVLLAIQERQVGRYLRSDATPYGHKVDLTEFSMWREAYTQCDKGEPLEAFSWVYGMAAELAGL